VATSSLHQSGRILGDVARYGEIRSRLLFLIGALVVFRLGTYIPVPGINPSEVARFFNDQSNGILGIVNMFSGGGLSRLSIFAMGVMPYISASIIIQMMSMVVPSLMELRKEGESGRRKLTELTRYITVGLAAFQSFAAAVALQNGHLTLYAGFPWLFTATITMTTGTLFLMWLGEQITERGVGNGISMIIVSGIIAGFPGAVGRTAEAVNTGEMQGPFALLLILIVLGVTAFVVFVERAQRRIAVNYAKRQVGRRMYAGQSSHLPFKLNMSGVIPPIFASSLLLFPATIANFAAPATTAVWRDHAEHRAGPGLRAAAAPSDLRAPHRVLLLLLHGARLQCARHGGESEEIRRLHSRHPPGRADRRLHRPRADAPHPLGSALRDGGVRAARDPDLIAGRAVPVWRHLAPHRRGGGDGFHVAAAGAHDVASLSGAFEEGESS
jgi:preprotein translocase subunit SecY